jgi:hypothetical protein
MQRRLESEPLAQRPDELDPLAAEHLREGRPARDGFAGLQLRHGRPDVPAPIPGFVVSGGEGGVVDELLGLRPLEPAPHQKPRRGHRRLMAAPRRRPMAREQTRAGQQGDRAPQRGAIAAGLFPVLVPLDRLAARMHGPGEDGLRPRRAQLDERALLVVRYGRIIELHRLDRRRHHVEPMRRAATRAAKATPRGR